MNKIPSSPCCVCLETIDTRALIQCGHVVCKKCRQSIAEEMVASTLLQFGLSCPMCRAVERNQDTFTDKVPVYTVDSSMPAIVSAYEDDEDYDQDPIRPMTNCEHCDVRLLVKNAMKHYRRCPQVIYQERRTCGECDWTVSSLGEYCREHRPIKCGVCDGTSIGTWYRCARRDHTNWSIPNDVMDGEW